MRSAVVVGIVAALAAPTPAHADDELAEARKLEAALDYEHALALVEGALAHGGADPDRLVELHLLAGELAAGLDRAPVAEDHFARALALRPTAQLAAGASPKLTAPLEAARARSRVLAVRAVFARGFASLVVGDDPLGLVVGIAVHVVDHGTPHDVVEPGATRVSIPAGATVAEVAALDGRANRVWIGAPAIDPPAQLPTHASRAWIARWPVWSVTAATFAAVGGVLVWRRGVAQDDWNTLRADDGNHDYSQLTGLESRGRRDAYLADTAFGLAGAAAITAVVLYVTETPVVITPTTIGVAARF